MFRPEAKTDVWAWPSADKPGDMSSSALSVSSTCLSDTDNSCWTSMYSTGESLVSTHLRFHFNFQYHYYDGHSKWNTLKPRSTAASPRKLILSDLIAADPPKKSCMQLFVLVPCGHQVSSCESLHCTFCNKTATDVVDVKTVDILLSCRNFWEYLMNPEANLVLLKPKICERVTFY